MRLRSLGLALLLTTASPVLLPATAPVAFAQQKQNITLEDIWQKGTFAAKSVAGFNWMKDGRYYSSLEKGDLVQNEVTTGQPVQTLVAAADLKLPGQTQPLPVDGYSFNADETKILFSTATEPIYRRSSKSTFYVYDRSTKQLVPLSAGAGKQRYATFSPDGKRVAFVRDNNVFVTDLATMRETAVTTNGELNKIINGGTDWVYEEEFEFAQGFHWSPDSRQVAFYRFDESAVPEYNMQEWGPLYPQEYRYKYPKAGEKNSTVGVSSVRRGRGPDREDGRGRGGRPVHPAHWLDADAEPAQHPAHQPPAEQARNPARRRPHRQNRGGADRYRPGLRGSKRRFALPRQAASSSCLRARKTATSHLYLYDMKGKLVRQLTKGNWEIASIEGFDAKKGEVYFTSTEGSPLQRHLYRINLKGKGKTRLSEAGGGVRCREPEPRHQILPQLPLRGRAAPGREPARTARTASW